MAGELGRLSRRGEIAPEEAAARLAAFQDAKRRARALSGTREAEATAVVDTLKGLARRRQLTAARLVPLWLTLERNLQWWEQGSVPASGQRIEFEGSELVWQYYRGQGLQLQVLANFGKLNALWSGRRNARLSALLDELLALRVPRAGGVAWEYSFTFNGGRPPWVSGMAQGTAVQALARAATRLGRQADVLPVAQQALALFEAPAPEGVRVSDVGGDHYALYSFAPDFRVINGFVQSLIGLHEYVRLTGDPRGLALFEAGERRARVEVPTFDTGAWSLYSRGSATRESDLGYHDLVIDFLGNLCERTGVAVYCETAARFEGYKSTPPVVAVRGRELRGGRPGRVRFSLSKVSSVDLRITRGDAVVEERPFGTVGFGERTFGWDVPRRPGAYTVELTATDLAGNVAGATTTVEVLRPKRNPRGP